MHITRMTDNQLSILVCSKWERKPTLRLNYIANHFLPAEWQSAAVGGFHTGPQIQHWLINVNFKCVFLGGWACYRSAHDAEEILQWVTDSKVNGIFAIR